jgi:murein DD-endopeptidase MepM/ murein hydrolase activator NlpD
VQEQDTLSSIAEKLGLDGGELPGWQLLVSSNAPDINSADDFIQPGQKLRVPSVRGIVHTVLLGETVSDLAERFGVTSDSIVSVNGLADGNVLSTGQILLIADPQQVTAPPTQSSEDEDNGQGSPEQAAPQATPVPSSQFIWPVSGPITSYFGPSHPLGIDIGLGADGTGIPIAAAMSGVVTFAGGDACCSYGYYVVISHGNGFETLYAHLSKIDVSVGESVSQGETIGLSGTTGYSTGPHLHFEVHKNGKVVDPLQFLP